MIRESEIKPGLPTKNSEVLGVVDKQLGYDRFKDRCFDGFQGFAESGKDEDKSLDPIEWHRHRFILEVRAKKDSKWQRPLNWI